MIQVPVSVLSTLLEAYKACEKSPLVGNTSLNLNYTELCSRIDDRVSILLTKEEVENLLYHADLACGEKLPLPVPYQSLVSIRNILRMLNPDQFEMSPVTYQYELRS